MQYISHYSSPIGVLTLVSDGEALSGILFEGHGVFGTYMEKEDLPIIALTIKWLDAYFDGRDPGFTPKLCFNSTSFREEVWAILQTIPYGRTMSYGEIAKVIAKKRGIAKMSAQAVGNAVGSNPLPIIIPCHRVIGSDGSMVGYGGGLDKKIKLLHLEGIL